MPDPAPDGSAAAQDSRLARALRRSSTDSTEDSNAAIEALVPLVYDELRTMARVRMQNERQDHTLQATALVHEAFLKLSDGKPVAFDDRAQFFGAAARAMQCILLDHARKHGRQKRRGKRVRHPLNVVDLAVEADLEQVQAVEEAIDRLGKKDDRMAQIVKLRFYAGLGAHETAQVLGCTEGTVLREWTLARAWLARDLGV
jgi:RNA polymerase sigma factor (TIGR02999 family)